MLICSKNRLCQVEVTVSADNGASDKKRLVPDRLTSALTCRNKPDNVRGSQHISNPNSVLSGAKDHEVLAPGLAETGTERHRKLAQSLLSWPRQEEDQPHHVYVHILSTRVRKPYRCQVVIVRTSLDAPLSATCYWASSDLTADAETLLIHIAARWDIEVLFADTKELLGLDQYQVMSATSIQRFWILVMAAYVFLDEERHRLGQQRQVHVTIGKTRREIQRIHHHMFHWLYQHFKAGSSLEELIAILI